MLHARCVKRGGRAVAQNPTKVHPRNAPLDDVGQVAILGLGAMGGAAAAALAAGGVRTVGFDPSAAASQRAAQRAVAIAESAEQAASGASIVVLSLPTPRHVLAVVDDLVSTLAPEALVVDLSTIDPETAKSAAQRVRAVGSDYVDAPVLGRPAAVGAWTCVAGGRRDSVQRAERLLQGTVARKVLHVGDVGGGSLVKVLNNLMFGAINAITVEALALAEAAGLDPGVFVDAVKDSGAAAVSGLFRDVAPRIVDGDFAPVFATALLHKDNQLAMDIADRVGVPLIVGRSVQQLNTMAMREGVAADDSGAVIRVYENLMGITVRRHQPAGTPESPDAAP
jgi:3-hydroxyisobutyrate dehydrogenase-like beta-hydroxyacid dehydrogenase